MSTQLEQQGITLHQGYDPEQLNPAPDLVVVGNAMSRGNPAVEYMLEKGLRYTSGLHNFCPSTFCTGKWVLAAARATAKPQPAVCWPGFWSMRAWRPVS